jgi:hypothetical protein
MFRQRRRCRSFSLGFLPSLDFIGGAIRQFVGQMRGQIDKRGVRNFEGFSPAAGSGTGSRSTEARQITEPSRPAAKQICRTGFDRAAFRGRAGGVGTKGVPIQVSTACGASNKGLGKTRPVA